MSLKDLIADEHPREEAVRKAEESALEEEYYN